MPWRVDAALALIVAAGSVQSASAGYETTGLASWYGEEVGGNPTASGTPFDPAAVTVAHRTLPLGSFVKVTALESGRVILARVVDRGPGRGERLVDLSRGAAQLLGIDRMALAAVRLRAVTPRWAEVAAWRAGRPLRAGRAAPARQTSTHPSGRYQLQVASFLDAERARALAKRLGAGLFQDGERWRVRLGPFSGVGVQRARDAVAARGYGDALVLAQD